MPESTAFLRCFTPESTAFCEAFLKHFGSGVLCHTSNDFGHGCFANTETGSRFIYGLTGKIGLLVMSAPIVGGFRFEEGGRMTNWRGGADMGIEAASFGRWDIHVSDFGDKYYWCVSSAYGTIGTGLSDTRERAKVDALDNLIKLIDEWRCEAVRARGELGGIAARD